MNLYAGVDVQRKAFVMLNSASGFGRFTSVKLPTASRTVDIQEDKHIYFHVIHNINKTHSIKCHNLMVLGYMFRPHCGHLQANLYRLSALNVRTIWDLIVCTIVTYVR